MKIKSLEELESYLYKELSWRKKEISLVWGNYNSARCASKEYYWRAGIVLLYAHWEGFVKKAAQAYLAYINFKGYTYIQLTSNFRAIGIPYQFEGEISTKRFKSYETMVDFIENKLSSKFFCDVEKTINTKSNLNYETFEEIASIIDIQDDFFEMKKNMIDEQLIKYRNKIAHGEQIHSNEMSEISLDNLKDEVVSLLEFVNTKILNILITRSYLLDH